eukprot:2217141-Pyramimonas_sp.AAC.1
MCIRDSPSSTGHRVLCRPRQRLLVPQNERGVHARPFQDDEKADTDDNFSVLVDEDPKLCLSGFMLTKTYLGL